MSLWKTKKHEIVMAASIFQINDFFLTFLWVILDRLNIFFKCLRFEPFVHSILELLCCFSLISFFLGCQIEMLQPNVHKRALKYRGAHPSLSIQGYLFSSVSNCSQCSWRFAEYATSHTWKHFLNIFKIIDVCSAKYSQSVYAIFHFIFIPKLSICTRALQASVGATRSFL